MFSVDKAIDRIEDDCLSRKEFAEKFSDAINNIKGDESIVLSINGTWGSGKSSIINLIKRFIEKKYTKRIKILNFNPWFYTDKQNLILKFFDNLSNELGLLKDIKNRKKIIKNIADYSKNFEHVTDYVPYIRGAVKTIKSTSESINEKLEKELLNIEKQRVKIREEFKKLNYKFLIVIDDIDRLNDNEIRDIVQLVKLIGDIPNIIYLLSFERDAVCKALDKFQEGKGKEYLEKIIQVPFELPLVSKEDIESLLFENINVLLKNIPEEEFEMDRWQEIYREGLRFQFKTIRHINRYVNVLKFDFALLKNEVNFVDLIGITSIKVFHPELYEIIKNNKEMFLDIPGDSVYSLSKIFDDKENGKYKDKLKKLIEGSNVDFPVRRILLSLFPKTYEAIGDGYYSSIEYDENDFRRKQRICSADCFDIYFLFRVPKEIITNNEMKRVLEIKDQTKLKEELISLRDKGKIISYLDRLEDFTNEIVEKEFSMIINTLYDLGDTFEDRSGSDWLYSCEVRISRITFQLLKRITDKNKRFILIKNAIEKANTSLYIPIREIAGFDELHGRFDSKDKKVKEKDLLFNESDLNELENLGRKKIEEWMKKGKLINSRYLLFILYRWERWGGSDNIKEFIKENYKPNEKLINLLTKFLRGVSNRSSAGYETKYHYEMEYKSAKHFLDIDFVYKKFKELTKKDVNKLDKLGKNAVKLFIDHYEGKIDKFKRI